MGAGLGVAENAIEGRIIPPSTVPLGLFGPGSLGFLLRPGGGGFMIRFIVVVFPAAMAADATEKRRPMAMLPLLLLRRCMSMCGALAKSGAGGRSWLGFAEKGSSKVSGFAFAIAADFEAGGVYVVAGRRVGKREAGGVVEGGGGVVER